MTNLPIEYGKALIAKTEAWNEYQFVIDRPHTTEEVMVVFQKADSVTNKATEWYHRWQAVGGTSDIESIEAAELEQEQHKALKIVLDATTQDPRIARRTSILDAFRDEPMSKAEAAELYGELAEIDQALQFNPSDTCNDYITAAWDKNLEEVKY